VTYTPPALNHIKFSQSLINTYLHDGDKDVSSGVRFPLSSSLALAQHDHRGDGMDGMGGIEGGTMKMYLHFAPDDSVLFGPWIPNTDRDMHRGVHVDCGG